MGSYLSARGGESAPWQEGFQVIGAGGLWEFGEEPREVGMWLDAILAGTECGGSATAYDDGAWSRLPAPISQRGWPAAAICARARVPPRHDRYDVPPLPERSPSHNRCRD